MITGALLILSILQNKNSDYHNMQLIKFHWLGTQSPLELVKYWKPKSKFHKPFSINAKLDRLIIDIGCFMTQELTLDIVASQEEKLKEWVIVEQVDEWHWRKLVKGNWDCEDTRWTKKFLQAMECVQVHGVFATLTLLELKVEFFPTTENDGNEEGQQWESIFV